MILMVIRILALILVLVAIYILISLAQARDARERLEAEYEAQNAHDTTREAFVEHGLVEAEKRARKTRFLLVVFLPAIVIVALVALATWA